MSSTDEFFVTNDASSTTTSIADFADATKFLMRDTSFDNLTLTPSSSSPVEYDDVSDAVWWVSSTSVDLPLPPHSALTTFLIAVVATILSAVTSGGNLLVIASFRVDAQLQRVSNYFLFSLAIADFAIGAVSMPLYTAYLLLDYWPLGKFKGCFRFILHRLPPLSAYIRLCIGSQ
jgi:muscarinic acetylcholine receptor M3